MIHLRYDTMDSISAVAMAADGRVAAGTTGGCVVVWDTFESKPRVVLKHAHTAFYTVLELFFVPTGELVAVHENGRIAVEKPRRGPARTISPVHWSCVHTERALVAVGSGSRIRVWNADTRQTAWDGAVGTNLRGGLAFDSRSNHLVAATPTGFRRFDTDTGEALDEIGRPQHHGISLACSPTGPWLIELAEQAFTVWDTQANAVVRTIPVTNQLKFTGAVFHPDGRLITTGSRGLVQIWDPTTWTEVSAFAWRIGWTRAFRLAPDGATAVIGGSLGHVVVWDWLS